RFPDFESFFREYKRYSPDLSLRIMVYSVGSLNGRGRSPARTEGPDCHASCGDEGHAGGPDGKAEASDLQWPRKQGACELHQRHDRGDDSGNELVTTHGESLSECRLSASLHELENSVSRHHVKLSAKILTE